MRIGVGRIVLDYYGNDNVQKKRRELEALCQDLRRQFNLSAMEISDFEDAERCVMGFAAVIPDHWNEQAASSFVEKICETIDQKAFTRVTVEDWDILEHGGEDWTPQSDSDFSDAASDARAIIRERMKKRRQAP